MIKFQKNVLKGHNHYFNVSSLNNLAFLKMHFIRNKYVLYNEFLEGSCLWREDFYAG